MADKDNDEYQFTDLDAMSSDPVAEGAGYDTEAGVAARADKNNIKRNALIVVILVIVAMVLYKIVGSFYLDKNELAANIPTMAMVEPTPVKPKPQPIPQPIAAPMPTIDKSIVDNKTSQKLSELESTQQAMQSDVSSVNGQLGDVNNSVKALMGKMAELNGLITTLSMKVDGQSREIEQLTQRRVEAKRVTHTATNVPSYPKYYIQALIPGRAWLIAANGSTLTVRAGTVIAGYGLVRLIDASQGRVTTSSGQVIKFSQEDS